MNKDDFVDWVFTYGWAILIVLVAIGVLIYFGVPKIEEFNPELHNCTERADCPELTYIYGLYAVSEDGGTCLYKTTNGIAYYLPEEGEIPDVEIHTKCVSWQPKSKEVLEREYCKVNVADIEKCECVNNTSVKSFEYRDVNYSNTIEVNYFGYECKELIDSDSRYTLQRSRRRLVAVIPIKVERTYDCNLPCDGEGCYFETKCFEPLNQSLLKYKGTNDGFPVYCSSFGNTMRAMVNFTYGDGAYMRVNKQVCVEAVPRSEAVS